MSAEEEPLLYAERPEWADVTPIPQYLEGANPIAPIFYTEAYKDATNYFRAVVKNGEMSQRVLELTETIIRLNPAHYSAWQYRYQTLLAIKAPLDVELHLMDEIATKHLKTYQVWHHRRLLLTQLRTPAPELAFIAKGLQQDVKNYHTWAYRQWLLAHFDDEENLWPGELPFVEEMLTHDVRNNSAWHHRFFVVFQSGVRAGDEDREEVVRRELSYSKEKISLAPNNLSAWNYLRGVLDHAKMPYSTLTDFVLPYTVAQPPEQEGTDDVRDLDNPLPSRGAELPCAAAIEFLADVYEAAGGDEVQKAVPLWKSLANEHDTIRKKYWEHRISEADVPMLN